ncbi:hypothetical protein BDV39DRAFT_172406 [Aspergillus sergii]|uniref:Uncharacterized protein n=1 Tax=Aspergillus sergii TaxID=1034303 RepID=A0A5N6X737_9EURO|nr:hypothetical protein BDV39DRAFT_172406 [Aspergillus sergii]
MILLFSSFYGTRITAGYDYIVMIQHSPDLPPVAPDLTSTVRKGSREPWISTLDHRSDCLLDRNSRARA